MKISDLIAVGLIGLSVIAFHEARGAPLTQEQATLIYALAHSTTGYKLPDKPPTIHLVSQQKLQEMACPEKKCPVHGMSVGEDIYLDETLDMADVRSASILYHETVHFLQFANRGAAKNCEEWAEREAEAYTLQNYVLERAGARPVVVPAFRCL